MDAPKKITWAIEAFAATDDLQIDVGKTLRKLFSETTPAVEPVFVAPPPLPGMFVIEDPGTKSRMETEAKKRMAHIIGKSGLTNVSLPQVIFSRSASIQSMVKELVQFAKAGHSELIVTGTRARRGLPRFCLGSFAERLVLETEVPVLAISPNCKTTRKPRHVLFPTDFSSASMEAFEKALGLSKLQGLPLQILHVEPLLYPLWGPALFGADTLGPRLNELRSHWRREGNKLVERAQAEGLKAQLHLVAGRKESAAERIVRVAKDLPAAAIVMAAQSDSIESAILGSTTRQVLRTADCPVFVVHTAERRDSPWRPSFQPRGAIAP